MADTPILPSFHATANGGTLTKREDIIMYVVKHTLNSPGGTSDLLANQVVSLRALIAKYDQQYQQIASEYQQGLTAIFQRYFGNVVVVSVTPVVQDNAFKFLVTVGDAGGTPYISTMQLQSNEDGQLVFKFSDEV
jgi:hypothetical protein